MAFKYLWILSQLAFLTVQIPTLKRSVTAAGSENLLRTFDTQTKLEHLAIEHPLLMNPRKQRNYTLKQTSQEKSCFLSRIPGSIKVKTPFCIYALFNRHCCLHYS